MSWLHLVHSTTYDYSEAVWPGPHRLVLRPREGHDVRVDDFTLRIQPAARITWHRDIFGNSVASVTDFVEAAPRLSIVSEAILWRTLADPSSGDTPAPDWPVIYDPLELSVAEAYRARVFPEDRQVVKTWLIAGEAPPPRSALHALEHLCQRIRTEIGYARRDEKGVFTPAQTLALRTGSCRDMAALFLEAGRELGFAMRFVTGYLECAASQAGNASTHAWVEAYLPRHGWRGFDPTSGRATTANHIVTGVSNHPRGVMPITGRYRGETAKLLGLTVSVLTERMDVAATT